MTLITAPPATWTAGMDTPKKSSTYAPISVEAMSRKKLLIATDWAIRLRCAAATSAVIAMNIGAPPRGSTIGSNAPIANITTDPKWTRLAIIGCVNTREYRSFGAGSARPRGPARLWLLSQRQSPRTSSFHADQSVHGHSFHSA